MITLDENHVYRVDGVIKPSVSEIIQNAGMSYLPNKTGDIYYQALEDGVLDVEKYGIPQIIPSDYILKAQKFGNAVHKATELHDLGRLNMDSLDPLLVPYIKVWSDFKASYGVVIKEIEQKFYNKQYNFCGTPDRIAVVKEKYYIIDLKTTSKIQRSTDIQIAGYDLGLGGGHKTMIVLLNPKLPMGYKVEFPTSPLVDRSLFQSALQIYGWKMKNGFIKRGTV